MYDHNKTSLPIAVTKRLPSALLKSLGKHSATLLKWLRLVWHKKEGSAHFVIRNTNLEMNVTVSVNSSLDKLASFLNCRRNNH